MYFIAIVGNRERHELEHIMGILRNKNQLQPNLTVVSGGADGIDTDAQMACKLLGIPILIIYPKLEEYEIKGNDIYFERNKRIAYLANEMHAFPVNNKGGMMNTVKHFRNMGKSKSLYIYNKEL